MSVHVFSLKGERDENEDAYNIALKLNNPDNLCARVNLFGIYDGHGGDFVSNYLCKNIKKQFVNLKSGVEYPLSTEFVNKTYEDFDKELSNKHKMESEECGSTCLLVCHFKKNMKDYINILNTGDSRCVICRNNIAMPLTKDHKPSQPDEENRIKKLGGKIRTDKKSKISRIDDLSVSRSFGDHISSKYVTYKPDIYKYKLSRGDKFLVIACDGLWDVCSNDEVINFVIRHCYDENMNRINKKVNIARELANYAVNEMHSSDNVTIIVYFLDMDKKSQRMI
jgi:protein phosphatase 1L